MSRKADEIELQLARALQSMFRRERHGEAMCEKLRAAYDVFYKLYVREIKRGIAKADRLNGRQPDIPYAIETMCQGMGIAIIKDETEAMRLNLGHCLCGYYFNFEQLENIMESVAWELDVVGTLEIL